MNILGDSGEYEFLTEAVELSKDVEGACLEIGLRMGLGTKTIIDAVRAFCPNKIVVSVDPFGNIPYTGREPDGETHYDYTDDMRNECLANMWDYVRNNPVDYKFINLSDNHFFEIFSNGIPVYGYNGWTVEKLYSTVHLDGPHTVDAVTNEIAWFNERMKSGATIIIDDVTPDFMDIEPINRLFDSLNWVLHKQGMKKNIYVKR